MSKYDGIKSKANGVLGDVLDGAKILDDYVIAKNVRVRMGLYRRSDDERIFDVDRTFGSEKSLLQILVAVLGTAAAIAAFVMMKKLRRAEKKRMKEKLRAAREAAKRAE